MIGKAAFAFVAVVACGNPAGPAEVSPAHFISHTVTVCPLNAEREADCVEDASAFVTRTVYLFREIFAEADFLWVQLRWNADPSVPCPRWTEDICIIQQTLGPFGRSAADTAMLAIRFPEGGRFDYTLTLIRGDKLVADTTFALDVADTTTIVTPAP